MLEFIRSKQGPLWIIVSVIIIISFVFLSDMSGNQRLPGSGNSTAFEIYGQKYSFSDTVRYSRLHNLAENLQLQIPGTQRSFADTLSYIVQQYQFNEAVQPDFIFNLLVLREELKQNGIFISDTEARDAYRNLPFMKNEKGEFDGNVALMVQNQLGSMGFQLADLYELMRDYVGLQRLMDVISGSVNSPAFLSEKFYVERFQSIDASSIAFATEDFKKDIKISDEDIAKAYEESKSRYMSDEKRSARVLFFPSPDVANMNETDRAAANKTYADQVNNAAIALVAEDAKLETQAQAHNLQIVELTDLTIQSNPEQFKDEFNLLAQIFRNSPQTHPISDAVQGNKGYYFFSVTNIVAPEQLPLEAVKERISNELIQQKANEALATKINETRTQLTEAIKAGKSFEDAVAEAGIKAEKLPTFSITAPLADLSNAGQIMESAASTAKGQFTAPIASENGSVLVFVNDKKLYENEERKDMVGRFDEAIANSMRFSIFRAWFESRRAKADLNADGLIRFAQTQA